jgi:hypothetical protein
MCYITWDLTEFGVGPIETAVAIKGLDILLIDHEHVQVFDAEGYVLDLRLSSKGWVWAWPYKGAFGKTGFEGWSNFEVDEDGRATGLSVHTTGKLENLVNGHHQVRAYPNPAVAIRHIVDRNWCLKRRHCARLRLKTTAAAA